MTYDTINDAQTIAGNGEGTLLAGRYRIVRQLGQGGMGSVWLAEDTQLDNKLFALKMMPSILVANKRAYRQLKDEALVAMRLVHPNIVQVRAFEENNGNPFLVMDYVDGQTLDDYLAEHTGTTGVSPVEHAPTGTTGVSPVAGAAALVAATQETGLPEADVLRILRPIAAALDYAHGEGVVHRDVKPGNVMIAKDGTPYILDFGIAREIQETLTRVTGKLSSGTLLYMSPEQLMGEQPRPAQDIYSFAAMAYECLKGEPPFSHGQIEFQIMNKRPDPPPGGTQLVASVMAGLAKKPEVRPTTCAAVLEGNNLTQRRREAESQGGRARRPAEPVVRRVPTPPQSGESRSCATETEGPRSRAAVKGILAVALLAVLAGGAWWLVNARAARSTGTTGVSPVAPNAPTGTTGVSPVATNAPTGTTGASPVATNAPTGTTGVSPVVTDADVVAIAVEASVQKDRIARIDDADGFKEKKDEVSGLLTRATSYGKARRYKESAQAFSNYVERCRELVRLDGERKSALKDKAKAQEAFQIAESAGAKLAGANTYAGSSWNTAVGVWRQASEQFGRMEFSQAGRTFSFAAELFRKCGDAVKETKAHAAAEAKAKTWVEERVNGRAKTRQRNERIIVGHKGVQLWEGGPYWAETNIGAEKPEDYGYYFWWGDTVGYKREGNSWVASDGSSSYYSFAGENMQTIGRDFFALKREGWITGENVLVPQHDVAQVQWGGGWRIPTEQELDNLASKCDWTWTTMNGVNGYVVRGRGDYAFVGIFLPAAGYGDGTSLDGAGSNGFYWSSVPTSDIYNDAWALYFDSGDHDTDDRSRRNLGQSVRPVQGFTK